MKFRFTLRKTIVSLAFLIGVDYLLASQTTCLDAIGASCPSTLSLMITPMFLLYSLIPVAILYIIWSLIQKKS